MHCPYSSTSSLGAQASTSYAYLTHRSTTHCPCVCWSAKDKQSHRFKHVFRPDQSNLPEQYWLTWPTEYKDLNSGHVAQLTTDQRCRPGDFWDPQAPPDALQPGNPYAQKFRIRKTPVPVPVSFPGSEYWTVEMLNDYSKEWPSIRIVDGYIQFRKGFLGPVVDPKAVPFFFYKGLEHVRYTVGDRAFQLLFTAAYAGKCMQAVNALSSTAS